LVGFLVIAPLLAFLALGLGKDPMTIESPLVGKPAPSFGLTDLDGKAWDLDALHGRPAVINFWATWCQPCVWEHPILVDAAQRYRGKVQFVGIILHDEPENIRAMVTQRGTWGPSLIDPGSTAAIAYGVYGAPETYFLDKEGTIVYKHVGPVTPDAIDRVLGPLL
jgi:cytochrome c biogenesis protein CcmG/thiol:disulfide interchange protein DsbE